MPLQKQTKNIDLTFTDMNDLVNQWNNLIKIQTDTLSTKKLYLVINKESIGSQIFKNNIQLATIPDLDVLFHNHTDTLVDLSTYVPITKDISDFLNTFKKIQKNVNIDQESLKQIQDIIESSPEIIFEINQTPKEMYQLLESSEVHSLNHKLELLAQKHMPVTTLKLPYGHLIIIIAVNFILKEARKALQ